MKVSLRHETRKLSWWVSLVSLKLKIELILDDFLTERLF